MGAIVKARTISAVVDNRIQLNNSSCTRLWSADLGTTWNSIRIGCRITIQENGGNITSTPRLAFGIQSGDTTKFMDVGGPTNWCGIISNIATWTRNAGPPVRYDALALWHTAKKVGTVLTVGTDFSGGTTYTTFDATTDNRACIFVTITKGSPNYTFTLASRNSTASGDILLATYLQQIVIAVPTLTNHNNSAGITQAVDEVAGSFNAVGIAWDHSDALVELSDVTVVRLS